MKWNVSGRKCLRHGGTEGPVRGGRKTRSGAAEATVTAALMVLLCFALSIGGANTALGAETGAEIEVETGAETGAKTGTRVIQYQDLRELLKAGNPGLKEKIDDYNNNVQTYQDMWDAFKWEQWDMESKAEDMKNSDAAASSLYASNAAMLKSSARNMYKQIDKMTGEKSTRSLEKEADSLTMAAQALMNSYNQMAVNARAKAKSAEAAQASWEAVKARYSIGSATLADVQAAEQRLTNARNAAASMEEQAAQLKADLLLLLGMEPGAQVEIGAVPAPDLEAVAAIDVEADRNKALGNNSSVLSARHAKAVGTAAQNRREKQVNQAEGEAEADLNSLFQTVVEKRTAYEGAAASWESAQMIYNSLQNKQSAGMLTNTEYLEGEASYLEKQAAWESASMALRQAYENYRWEVMGVSEARQ